MAIETLQAPPHRLVGTDPASQQRPGPPSPGGGRHELPLHQARPRHRPQHRRGDQTMEHSTPKTTARGATVADAASAVSGPDEERWRKHGGARRLQLLEEDRLRGGRDFSMSLDCSIQRYFQAAHWALEQFHQLYQAGADLEETYVMGHRIVCFLTDCLPQHPGLFRTPEVRQRASIELELLQECLEDLALRIDEEACNQFVADFDPAAIVVDDDDDDVDDDVTEDCTGEEDEECGAAATMMLSPAKSNAQSAGIGAKRARIVRFEDWVAFPETETEDMESAFQQRKTTESPTAETVESTGTGSLEPVDNSYISSSSDGGRIDHPDLSEEQMSLGSGSHPPSPCYLSDSEESRSTGEEEDAPFPSTRSLYPFHVRLDFLSKIAKEKVTYETDSDAADSWAQGDGEAINNYRAPSSSGGAPTCDPARIAFRDLMNRLPRKQSLLSAVGKRDNGATPSASPIFLDILSRSAERMKGNVSTTQETMECAIQNKIKTEERVNSEIQCFLESDEDDATKFVESCQEKLRKNIPIPSETFALDAGPEFTAPSSTTGRAIPSSASSFSTFSPSSTTSSALFDESCTSPSRPFATKDDGRVGMNFERFQDNFLEDDSWVAFDNSQSTVKVNFFAAAST